MQMIIRPLTSNSILRRISGTGINLLKTETMVEEEFRFPELLKRPVLQPFLIILVMMVLLQFSGQGAVTFYTAQIFKVGLQISRRPD